MNSVLLPQKTFSWLILFLLFTFDAVISYWGVVYMHGREADLLIAPYVEKYPLLYFPTVLANIFLMLLLSKGLLFIAEKAFRYWGIDRTVIERIILATITLYWAVGNSSGNLLFLLGFRVSNVWLKTTLVAIPITLAYVLLMLYQTTRLKKVK